MSSSKKRFLGHIDPWDFHLIRREAFGLFHSTKTMPIIFGIRKPVGNKLELACEIRLRHIHLVLPLIFIPLLFILILFLPLALSITAIITFVVVLSLWFVRTKNLINHASQHIENEMKNWFS